MRTLWLTALTLLLSVAQSGSAQCVILNECGLLGERVYSGSANNPEVIVYRDNPVTFANGAQMSGLKLSFQNDVNPSLPYLGVWRLPKGGLVHVRLINQHPSREVNLHFHGLHVKGTGQDDPTVVVQPGETFNYQLNLGANHGGGTHWIHPHIHGSTVANIGGNALGLMIVPDDPGDREVPTIIRTAPTYYFIMQRQQPRYWTPPNTALGDFMTVNGIANNPVLQITQLKWTRIRALSVGVSFANIVNGRFVPQAGVSCAFVVIAKDGVYLRQPRYLNPPNYPTFWNEASRADLMVRCDGVPGSEVQFFFGNLPAFRLRIVALPQNVAPDLFNLDYNACLPRYLADTFGDTLTSPTLSIGPTMRFLGFDQQNALATYPVGSTFQLNLGGFAHPFHIHVNHFQIQQDDATGWFRRGDWHDTAENVVARMRLSSYNELVLIHCHNVEHQDTFNQNGMMGIIWISGNQQLPTTTFAQDCPNVVPLLNTGTFTPTVSRGQPPSPGTPSPDPTSPPPTSEPPSAPGSGACRTLSADTCGATAGCYLFEPAKANLDRALKPLKVKKRNQCKNKLGCRSEDPGIVCNFNACIPLCRLNPRCRVVKVQKKNQCRPIVP